VAVAHAPQARECVGNDAVAPAGRAALPHVDDPRRLRPAEVLALQRSVGNGAVGRLLARAVRIDGGKKKVDEAFYKTGKGTNKGIRHKVSSLIDDPIRRVFTSTIELENYAEGISDHIGDVVTQAAGTFWFRLPLDKLTVIGEEHHNKDGNVEDVIRGLRTIRWMYEPFNELKAVAALAIPFTETEAQLKAINKGISIAPFSGAGLFDPELENIVIKALTGTTLTRNEYIAASKKGREAFKGRASTNDYSFGERIALYLSMAIHIAHDVAQHSFAKAKSTDSKFIRAGRALQQVYLKRQAALDAFTAAKDGDQLVGIFELTKAGDFANVPAIKEFTIAFHEYGARYIEQLGTESTNAELQAEGRKLAKNLNARLDELSPAREAIMWQKIQGASSYLIVGMGDAHRVSLQPKLDAAGIPHFKIDEELVRQKQAIDAAWVP
jgi:hypothetical protein